MAFKSNFFKPETFEYWKDPSLLERGDCAQDQGGQAGVDRRPRELA